MGNVTQQFIVYQTCSTTGVEINIVKKKRKKKKKALLKKQNTKSNFPRLFLLQGVFWALGQIYVYLYFEYLNVP
jgi:hypothetical protein